MNQSVSHRIRGLFFIDAQKRFNSSHQHWNTIAACADVFSEIHVVVLTHGNVSRAEFVTNPIPGVVVYHISRRALLFRFFSIWKTIMFNLRWRTDVRPDFVMNMTEGRHGWLAAAFARYIRRPFFSVAQARLSYVKGFSLSFWITKRFLHQARGLFVSSDNVMASLATKYHLAQDSITVSTPPIDPELFDHTAADTAIMFEHRGYNFFIASVVKTKRELKSLRDIYRHVEVLYPRTASIVFVEERLYRRFSRIIKSNQFRGMFVYKKTDQFIQQLKGAHIYLSISKSEDISTTLLQALSLEVPVVAMGTGLVSDIFRGSPYERFLSFTDDHNVLAHSVVLLIEDQRLRNEYALNTKMLLAKAPMVTPVEYAKVFYGTIASLIDPASFMALGKEKQLKK